MKKTETLNDRRPWSHKKKTWFTIATTALVIVLAIGIINIINAPRDLGDKLVFLKKVNTACEWWEFAIYLGLCRKPSYDYYFATDMSKEELKNYFKKARYIDDPNRGGGASSTYTYDTLYFESPKVQEEFFLDFYNETQAVKDIDNLQTDKKNIISMPKENYELAKDSL